MKMISKRKLEHLDLCAHENVESERSTLLEEVELVHDAIPELSFDEIDPSVQLLGRQLRSPILISGMTGGAQRAGEINRAFAAIAQEFGFAMGLGSQRSMLEDAELAATYAVRDLAPDILLLANIGCVQARECSSGEISELVDAIGADALCIHLNVAQELTQDEGDRDFRGCLETISRLAKGLRAPIIVKETGCGFSPRSLLALREAGATLVDVAGAGGTTWPGVESLRGSARQRALGAALREWGVPTAASLVYAERLGITSIASGGIRSAQDVVVALALGASVAGLALPFLRAHEGGGIDGVRQAAETLSETVRALMLLVGARTVADLARIPLIFGPKLEAWTQGENSLAHVRATQHDPHETRGRRDRGETRKAREYAV